MSLASKPLEGEHGMHGASDSSGAVGFKDIDNSIDQTGASSAFENSKSQNESAVSSARGQVKRSASDIQRGSQTDRLQHHQQVAENYDDAGLEQRRTSFENLLCIDFFFQVLGS